MDLLEMRYEYDSMGRMLARPGVGDTPRFVLGRAAEGCVWRFRSDLDVDLINRVAKLAGRESAFPFGGEKPVCEPERLAMIGRLLGVDRAGICTRRELVSRSGVEIADIWTID
ncbi:MAG: hypothetical protein CL908_04075 [Deltaproteobacteria bacterium]|nr:hypothetical protein [Deltaproteobacteria bacterium]